MANRKLPEGKRIHMYKSGDAHYTGASMVVNPLHTKTLDKLLTDVTTKVDPTWGAVRSIHTPNTGTVVKNLEDLHGKGAYVAAGPKGFVSIPGGYENIGKPINKKKLIGSQKIIHKSGVKTETFTISVYKNGMEDAGVEFKYSSKDFGNWEQALYRLSEKVKLPQGPVKRLYHMNGKIVRKPEDMTSGESYVAAASNEQFRRANYGGVELPSDTKYSAPVKGSRKYSSSKSEGGHSNSSNSDRNRFSKGLTKRRGLRKKGGGGGGGEGGDDEEEEETGEGGGGGGGGGGNRKGGRAPRRMSKNSTAASKSRSQSQPRSTSLKSQKASSNASPSRRSSLPSENADGGGEEEATESALRRRSKSSYDIPLQIPENDDPDKVDYFKLQSNRPSPVTSPEGSPTSSRPTSADGSYGHRRPPTGFYAIQEEDADEVEEEGDGDDEGEEGEDTVRSTLSSRYSVVDSGRGSLFSDEERPDSVFKAKTKSRPVTRAREVDYDTDSGGVYRAKTSSEYSRGAQEILDSTETNIEIPVDLIDATEVQEEIYAN